VEQRAQYDVDRGEVEEFVESGLVEYLADFQGDRAQGVFLCGSASLLHA
jgi:hypothetical protein